MKGWHTLIPIIALIWGCLLIMALIDHNGQKDLVDPVIDAEEQPLTPEDLLARRITELNNSSIPRVCDAYLSRVIGGFRHSYGIICVEMGMEVYHTGIGLTGDYSQDHYDEHIMPVVNRLHREYKNQYGW